MARLTATSILILCFSVPSLACVCIGPGSPCSAFASTPIVILGHVLVDSGEGYGERRAKVRVEEVLRGLSPDIREVEVDTMPRSSCHARLQKDEQYVIFARTNKKEPGILFAGACSILFNVKGNELLLEAVRNAAAGGPPRLVGRVQSRSSRYGYRGDPIAQARVVAEAEGKRYETLSDASGWFEMLNVAPGPYRVEVSQAGHVFDDKEKEKPVEIPAAGCAVKDLGMTPAGRISGTVRYRDGHPVKGVKVGVFEMDRFKAREGKEEPESSPFTSANTAEDGSYSVHPLPPGKYIVGVNGDKYEDKDPHPASFYPNRATRQNAARIELATSAERAGIDLVLAEPRQPCTVKVKVTFEDGRPAAEAHTSVLDRNGLQRSYSGNKTDANGEVELRLFQGDDYEVEAFLFKSRSKSFRMPDGSTEVSFETTQFEGKSSPVRADKPEVHVQVVLRLKLFPSLPER